ASDRLGALEIAARRLAPGFRRASRADHFSRLLKGPPAHRFPVTVAPVRYPTRRQTGRGARSSDGRKPFMANRFTLTASVAALGIVLVGCWCASAAAAEPPAKATSVGPKIGDEPKDFELTALGGEKVKLSKATESGPVVLVVLRGYPGYQCPICSGQ